MFSRTVVPRCPVGTYIEDLSTGESACVPCPGNSFISGKNLNIRECTCQFRGYYRTKLEGPNFSCSCKEDIQLAYLFTLPRNRN